MKLLRRVALCMLVTGSAAAANTCTGTYPSYWQDGAPKFAAMWQGQAISNAPTGAYRGPVFRLSDGYPRRPVDERASQPWRAARFDALFNPATVQDKKRALAHEYAQLVFDYALAGNVNQPGRADFDVCDNPVRPWFHMPFQTYDAASGREFIHGLTREAPVTFSTRSGTGSAHTTMWALGLFNPTAAYTIGAVWQADGTARMPATHVVFQEGAVIAKPLFNTATVAEAPVLANMPAWNANISDPAYCACVAGDGKQCTLVEQSQQCPRNYARWNDVRLLQFDIAIRDSRARGTGWVYGTFVADGRRKAAVKEPWRRLSLLGLIWGKDTPPPGQLAYDYPADPRLNGFREGVIFWDVADELNSVGGTGSIERMGHLGSNQRLNGPADNANSSCLSCHATASVPDAALNTPPLLAQFSDLTKQSVAPFVGEKRQGLDRTGAAAVAQNGVGFSDIDAIYFANVMAGQPFQMTAQSTGKSVLPAGVPTYPDGERGTWISLDYSLQLSFSLLQWMQWQADEAARTPPAERKVIKALRRNQ